MAVVLLKDWDLHLGNWVLTPATGDLARWPDDAGVGNVGWVSLDAQCGAGSAPAFCAVYVQDRELWFQVGADRWLIDEYVTFVRDCDDRRSACRFSLTVGSKRLAAWHYTGPLGDPVNRADLSFDGLDEEMQDLRLFLARIGNDRDWRRRFVDRCSSTASE
ncbi:hypothetical protein [Yinghuangia sp. YIM S09857]|uniref:hypothetical protein n=1 Tax=Yinghuangia sp. YIM S09857 TaxID=3436929 RepID=UPI003F532F73